MSIHVRPYAASDLPAMNEIWNEVVREGIAFPQLELLDEHTGAEFFAAQTCCAVAEDENIGEILGLYILHPNNVGRCGHIANASFAVGSAQRGRHIGEALVRSCLAQARARGFRILQFNAVVKSNAAAQHLYEELGFVKLGVIPGGFRNLRGVYEDIILYYHTL